jgi:hypothetical protein
VNRSITSFNGLFATDNGRAIARVRVPIIQRDYAQGRDDEKARRIRAAFLDVLYGALTGGAPVVLDFVFGAVDKGTFTPLDGQQRLTTLFLLHWYLAARANDSSAHGWKRFTYETRASARAFCEALVARRPTFPLEKLSAWIDDQPWFLSTWRHDPTVGAMRVMLDAIHERFAETDCTAAWRKLIDAEHPAITFHLLPVEDMGRPDELYLKMNSRGKPLTPFETFKALFEKMLEGVDAVRAEEFAKRIDGAWSDMLWTHRGDDNLIDDEFMRYLHFVTEVCEWTEKRTGEGSLEARTAAAFGPPNSLANENLTRLFEALDAWCGEDSKTYFERHFALDRHEPGRVTLYPSQSDRGVDLFDACCRFYGELNNNKGRAFSLDRTLLLYATVVHRAGKTADFPRRLRVLRNVLEAASPINPNKMPEFVAAVRDYVTAGNLDRLVRVNKRQVDEEREKATLLAAHPDLEGDLQRLEDHSLLRGCLAAISLEAKTFAARAKAFEEIFTDRDLRGSLTGALLACGTYAPNLRGYADRFQFGTGSKQNDDVWRRILCSSDLDALDRLRGALSALLDTYNAAAGTPIERLVAISSAWLAKLEAAHEFDWRYYLVKYPAMREGLSGIYVGLNGSFGYSLCMLNGVRLSGDYRDPYLLAILRRADVPETDVLNGLNFRSYETLPRWLHLKRSGIKLRCVASRIEVGVEPSTRVEHAATVARVCAQHGLTVDGDLQVLALPQLPRGQHNVDTTNRIERAAALLRDLVAAGC